MENKIPYKGYVIAIDQDQYAESPDGNGDDELFLVGWHREFTVTRDGYDRDTVRALLNGLKDEDGNRHEAAHEIARKYHVFPLEAYIHSGVALYLAGESTTDRAYDVSALGAVFVKRIRENKWHTRAKAEKAARSLIAEWNMCLSGDVWCVTVQDQDGEAIDGSYGGSYGYDDSVQQAKETIDRIVESDIEPPYLKAHAREVLSNNFDAILKSFKDGKHRTQIGRALQKAIHNL